MVNNRKNTFLNKHKADNQNALKAANDSYPKFSFEFCFGTKKSIEQCSKDIKYRIMDKIIYLSQLAWKDISGLRREQGFERIDVSSLSHNSNTPVKFSDVNKVDVFRIGDKGRLIGYIEEDTFFIVWIDTKFEMYDH